MILLIQLKDMLDLFLSSWEVCINALEELILFDVNILSWSFIFRNELAYAINTFVETKYFTKYLYNNK